MCTTAGAPLTYTLSNGTQVTVKITGPGSVELHDEGGSDSDGLIDALVLTGTTAATQVRVTSSPAGEFSIGRILGGHGRRRRLERLEVELDGRHA